MPIWKIGFTGISNASASKYPINSMPPRANIKEPEPDKAKRIVCNPSGEKEISEEEVKNYLTENNSRINYIKMELSLSER